MNKNLLLFACMAASVSGLMSMELNNQASSASSNEEISFSFDELPSELQEKIVEFVAEGAGAREAWRNVTALLQVSRRCASYINNNALQKRIAEKISVQFACDVRDVADLAHHVPRLSAACVAVVQKQFGEDDIQRFVKKLHDISRMDVPHERDAYIKDFIRYIRFATLVKPTFFTSIFEGGDTFFHRVAQRGTPAMLRAALQDPCGEAATSPYVKVDAFSVGGTTPLLLAAGEMEAHTQASKEKIHLLLDHGASPVQVFFAQTTSRKPIIAYFDESEREYLESAKERYLEEISSSQAFESAGEHSLKEISSNEALEYNLNG